MKKILIFLFGMIGLFVSFYFIQEVVMEWDWILMSNVHTDFTDVIYISIFAASVIIAFGYFDPDLDFKTVMKVGFVVILLVTVLSGLETLGSMPQLRVKSNIQRIKLKAFDLKDAKSINILIKRLDGAEALN